VLVALAVVAGGWIIAASAPDRPASSQDPVDGAAVVGRGPSPSASASAGAEKELTGSEALVLFDRLRRRLEAAYRRRSTEALLQAVSRGSPQFAQSRGDLRLLERNNLLDRTRSRTLEVSIVTVDPGRFVVSERSVVRPRYVDDATYVEVDVKLRRTRSSSEWILERRGDRWVITSSRATD
jgi:hypothetical protein